MALESKFTSTCLTRIGSPTTASGTLGCTSQISSRPFWCARNATVRSATQPTNGQRRLSPDNVARYLFEKVIPGARNAPWARNLQSNGTFLDPAELAARWMALGADQEVVSAVSV